MSCTFSTYLLTISKVIINIFCIHMLVIIIKNPVPIKEILTGCTYKSKYKFHGQFDNTLSSHEIYFTTGK